MFEEYVAAVMADYEKKKENGALSLNLIAPTAAKVKAECMSVCRERFNKGDERVLRPFFESREDADAYLRTIRLTAADKFKTLSNFLKGVTTKTEDRNIELLGWLIDYEYRPYNHWQKRSKEIVPTPETKDEIKVAAEKPGKEIAISITPTVGKPAQVDTSSKNISEAIPAIAAVILAAVITFALYHYFGNADTRTRQTFAETAGSGGCMYWNGERYQTVPCNNKLGDTLIVALDIQKLNQFQKIMKTDTITEKSVGKIWYFKLDNKLEYFTAGGFHPVHPERKLRRLTRHMLEKYISNRDNVVE